MKKHILIALTCLASITALAQTTQIKVEFNSFVPVTVSQKTGEMVFGNEVAVKASAKITDSLVIVTDALGRETKYRVLRNYTGLDPIHTSTTGLFTISLFVIDDSTNKFWNIDLFKLDASPTSIGFSIHDMERTFRYDGNLLTWSN